MLSSEIGHYDQMPSFDPEIIGKSVDTMDTVRKVED